MNISIGCSGILADLCLHILYISWDYLFIEYPMGQRELKNGLANTGWFIPQAGSGGLDEYLRRFSIFFKNENEDHKFVQKNDYRIRAMQKKNTLISNHPVYVQCFFSCRSFPSSITPRGTVPHSQTKLIRLHTNNAVTKHGFQKLIFEGKLAEINVLKQ